MLEDDVAELVQQHEAERLVEDLAGVPLDPGVVGGVRRNAERRSRKREEGWYFTIDT
jgi:hypothetical protein